MADKTIVDIITQAREDGGNLPVTDISDSAMSRHIEDGLEEISRRVPNRALYYLTLETNKQDYAVETGLLDVLHVFPYFSNMTYGQVFGTEFDIILGKDLLYDWEMSQYDKLIEFLNRKQTLDLFDWDFRNDGKLYIIPPPSLSSNGVRCYYFGSKSWTLVTLPGQLRKVLVKYVTGHALIVAGRHRSRLSAPTRAGSTDFGLYDPLTRDGRSTLREFDEELLTEEKRWFWN